MLLSNQPESNELISYALHAAFPSIRLIEAQSAQWLLDHFDSIPLTAVITSHKLYGELNGLALAGKLRAREFTKPILMLSNSEEVAARAKNEGVDEFLSFERWSELPVRLAALITGVEEAASNL